MSNSYARIGFHSGSAGNQVGIGDYFRSLDDAGIPFIIKSVDDAGILWEAQEIARVSGVPHILIWRKSGVSGDQSKNYDTPDYSLDPALAAEKHWRAHMAAWPPELDPQFVWIETINEPDKHRAEWMADFSWHTAILAGSSGHKYIAFGWSNGEPYIGEVAPSAWVQPCMRAFLQLCAERPDRVAVGLHEYSFDVNDIQAGLPYHLGRFRSLFNTCDEFGITRPTTFITEWGWEKGRVPEPERAMDDIAWANALYSGYATIKGAALWYLGGGFDGIADQAQKLIKPVTEYSLSQGAPVEPPNAGDATGAARVDYARRYWVVPDRTPLLRRQEIYTLAAEKQITVGPSFDDAGLGNLTDKTAVLHSISHSSEQIMVDWYKKWYPGTKVEFENGAEEPAPFFLEWPVGEPMTKKRLTQMYGDRPDYYAQFGLPGHEGLDFAASQGSMIKACHDGIVYRVHTVDDHLYGIHVRIAHIFPDGVKHKTYYAHLESACVRAGDVVKRGQEIGKSGNTGNSTGPHLHVTLVLPGATAAGLTNYSWDIIDPTPFFDLTGVVLPTIWTADRYAFQDWAPDRFLAGVHARADGGDPRAADYKAVEVAELNALKLLSSCTPEHIDLFSGITGLGGDRFVMARLFLDFGSRVVDPSDFTYWLKDDMQRLYERGVRRFEVHNEPNLWQEGYGISWSSGGEFAAWFKEVAIILKARFPLAKFGFPGCSPGPNIMSGNGILARRDQWQFLEEAVSAVDEADFIGVHNYWTSRAEMLDEAHGMGWKRFARHWPNKLLLITEFGNPLPYISKQEKGLQYRDYYRALKDQRHVGAAFGFVLSGSGWQDWAWVDETGVTNEIPGIVGGRG